MKAENTPVMINGYLIEPEPCIICQQPIDTSPVWHRMGRWFCKEHLRKSEWFPTHDALSTWIDSQKGVYSVKP